MGHIFLTLKELTSDICHPAPSAPPREPSQISPFAFMFFKFAFANAFYAKIYPPTLDFALPGQYLCTCHPEDNTTPFFNSQFSIFNSKRLWQET